MSPLATRAQPDLTADGAPEINHFLFFDGCEAVLTRTLTPEEAYAEADALVRAADAANQLAADHKARKVRP